MEHRSEIRTVKIQGQFLVSVKELYEEGREAHF